MDPGRRHEGLDRRSQVTAAVWVGLAPVGVEKAFRRRGEFGRLGSGTDASLPVGSTVGQGSKRRASGISARSPPSTSVCVWLIPGTRQAAYF
jgi:hypothetical protein